MIGSARIGDVVGPDGVFVDGDWIESKDQDQNGDVRLIQLADIGDGVFRNRSNRFLTSATAEKLGCTFLKDGDILIARMPDPLGRACVFPGDAKSCVTAVDICIVRPATDVNCRWLAWTINSPQFRSAMAALESGTTRKRISRRNLSTLTFPLPPRDEQDLIVAEIEKQFMRLEAGSNLLAAIQVKTRTYRQSVLRNAVEGRLVATDAMVARRDGHSYINAETSLRAKGRETLHRQEYGDFMLPTLPEGWAWTSIQDLGIESEQIVLTGPFGTTLRSADFVDVGVPVLTIGCLQTSGIDLCKAAYVSPEKAADLVRYRLSAGDLLFSRMASVGRAGLVGSAQDGALFNYHIMRLRLDPQLVSPDYYLAYIRGSQVVRAYVKYVNHGATRDGINTEQLLRMPVALPPRSEQERICAATARHLSIVSAVEHEVAISQKRVPRVRASFLAAAFSGRLPG